MAGSALACELVLACTHGLISSMSLKVKRSSDLIPLASACSAAFFKIADRFLRYLVRTGIDWLYSDVILDKSRAIEDAV